MNPPQESTPDSVLDLATSKLRDVTVAEIPADLLSSTMDSVSRNANTSRPDPDSSISVTRAAFVLAAAVAVAAFFTIGIPRSSQVVFAQVLDNAKKADSVWFLLFEGSGKPHRCVAAGTKFRVQHSGGIVIIGDSDARKRLLLDPEKKAAGVFDMNDHAQVELGTALVEQLRSVQSEQAESIGTETVDGNRVDVFRINGIKLFGIDSSKGTMKVFVDPESALPARIEVLVGTTAIVSLREMDWNTPVDASMLQLQIPKGYAEQAEDFFTDQLRSTRESNRKLTPTEAFRKWSGQSE